MGSPACSLWKRRFGNCRPRAIGPHAPPPTSRLTGWSRWNAMTSAATISEGRACYSPETAEHWNSATTDALQQFRCFTVAKGSGGRCLAFPAWRPWAERTQLQKMRRFRKGHSDLNAGRGSFSSPRHPYPRLLGPIRGRGSLIGLTLPSIQISAATPLHCQDLRMRGSNGRPSGCPPYPGFGRYTATRPGRVGRPRRRTSGRSRGPQGSILRTASG